MLITAGVLVEFIAVYVVLASDNAVEIFYLEVDTPGGNLLAPGLHRASWSSYAVRRAPRPRRERR